MTIEERSRRFVRRFSSRKLRELSKEQLMELAYECGLRSRSNQNPTGPRGLTSKVYVKPRTSKSL